MNIASRLLALGVAALVSLASESLAQQAAAPSTSVIVLRRCVLEYDQSTTLSAHANSSLQERFVKLGEKVKAGQILGHLSDRVPRAEMALFAADAETTIRVRSAEVDTAQNLIRYQQTAKLSNKSFVSTFLVRHDKCDYDRAVISVEEAELGRRIADLKRQVAEAQVQSLRFVSPHDGVVVAA